MVLSDDKKAMRTRRTIANQRIESALLRLEKAMVKNAEPQNSANLEKISALVQENNKLKDTYGVIEDRLNSSIKNLKTILKKT